MHLVLHCSLTTSASLLDSCYASQSLQYCWHIMLTYVCICAHVRGHAQCVLTCCMLLPLSIALPVPHCHFLQGGYLAVSLAAAHPSAVKGLILLNATPFWAFLPHPDNRRGLWRVLPGLDGTAPGPQVGKGTTPGNDMMTVVVSPADTATAASAAGRAAA